MAQYIDKSALVAEIEKRQKMLDIDNQLGRGGMVELQVLKDKIDTIEVKKVNLKGELNNWRHEHFHGRRDKEASGEYLERVSQLNLAKHFFELGLKAQKGE